MKKQTYSIAFSFLLTFLLFFRICTINEDIKYNMNIYPQEKVQTINSHDENTRVLLLSRKDISLESDLNMEFNLNNNALLEFLFLVLVILFKQPIFDIRKKITRFILSYLNSSNYKDFAFFLE